MKRIIALIITASMVLSFNYVVFADQAQDGAKQKDDKGIKTELAAMKTEFQSNKTEISDLKNKITADSAEVKTAIASLKENDSQVSEEEIEELKQSIAALKSDKTKLRETNSSQMGPLIEEFKAAMKSRDFQTAKSCLEEVIEIQEVKIQIFNQISSDTNAILEIIGVKAQ